MKYLEDVLIAPLISEKSYDRIADSNSYTFFVHKNSNKPEIKRAVQELFDVDVLSVNTMYRKGKKKKRGRSKKRKRQLLPQATKLHKRTIAQTWLLEKERKA